MENATKKTQHRSKVNYIKILCVENVCSETQGRPNTTQKVSVLGFFLACIRTEYGGLQSKSLYSVQMRDNADQKNSKYGHLSHSVGFMNKAKQIYNLNIFPQLTQKHK